MNNDDERDFEEERWQRQNLREEHEAEAAMDALLRGFDPIYCATCGTRLPHDEHALPLQAKRISMAHWAKSCGQPDRYDPATGKRLDVTERRFDLAIAEVDAL